ncbi:MAG: TonB-dependent receptor plug domain-containing protein [Flavobacteriaceae bacterium]|nr:TonB-dependent receptor plug domain-containing protein [Flavobacteriaceae bacterium]
MKVTYSFVLLLIIGVQLYAQQEDFDWIQDSVWNEQMEDVIVTGQINPQSVKESIYEVKVINRSTIENLAANNLADVLNQSLNINIVPNAQTGKSSVEMFGLDGQYFKILIDNIPMVNDEGMGNMADLTQINIDDIERIEIVEGAMGVEYGANAVSGVINIITKKSSENNWEITPYIQEETIGKEYNVTDQGRHIQSIRIGKNINKNWYANAIFTRNNFNGFLNQQQGKNHPFNDGLRGHEWLPKLQNNLKALLNYRGKFNFFYKFEYFDEEVNRYSRQVRSNYNPATQTSNPTASDDNFFSERYIHHINLNGKVFKQSKFDVSISYQQQKRDVEQFNYRILAGERFNIQRTEFESRRVFFSRGTLNNFVPWEKVKLQTGYELNLINGFASPMSNPLGGDQINRRLDAYDFFTTAEIRATSRLSFRPGARLMLTNQFDPLIAASFTTKYLFPNGWEIRGILGTAPRVPNYDELYTFFVDSNHDVRGNENLSPETGTSTFLHLKRKFWLNNDETKWQVKFSSWYIRVKDRIELTVINDMPLQYQFNNIDLFRTWGIENSHSFQHKNFNLNLGISVQGVSQQLDSRDFDDDFLYRLQANTNINYRIPKWDTTFSLFYNYNGPQFQFVQRQNEDGETELVRGKLESFAWFDASIRKQFINKRLDLTLGARNLMNIKQVNTTATEGGAHNDAARSLLLGYGRSFFLRIQYNLNF